MVFQSLTYAPNQYPPLSSTKSSATKEDIKSYTKLHKALVTNTELKKEGYDKVIINEEALAKLVSGIVSFQDVHLGRVSLCIYVVMFLFCLLQYIFLLICLLLTLLLHPTAPPTTHQLYTYQTY